MKILLTGAAGFVGWKTAEFLCRRGDIVVGIDNLNDYYEVTLKEWRLKQLETFDNFHFVQGDIERSSDLEPLFTRYNIDAIINLAARAGVRYSMENPDVYYSTNVLGNLQLLKLAVEYKVPKFVLASTSSLYAGQKLPFVETLPVNEPISPYAASKKAAEVTCYTWHKQFGIDVSIVRYFTVYGPAGRPDMSPLRFLRWIDGGKPIQLYGDGTQARDFTYIDDIARGTIAALKPLGHEVINLGGGNQPISINQMIQKFEYILGKDANINYLPTHSADMVETWADIENAKRMLNWEPEVSFTNGMEQLVRWHQRYHNNSI